MQSTTLKGGQGEPRTNAVITQQTPRGASTHAQPAEQMRVSLRISASSLGRLEPSLAFGRFLFSLLQLFLEGSIIFYCHTQSAHREQIKFRPILSFKKFVHSLNWSWKHV